MDPVRVLLVEDDDDNRELMAAVLATSGFDVVSAASGRDGLRSLAERSVDVIVTDVGMPGMGGSSSPPPPSGWRRRCRSSS